MHKTKYSRRNMNALWSGEKVSCPPSTVLHVEVCKTNSQDIRFKIKCAFNIVKFAWKLFGKLNDTRQTTWFSNAVAREFVMSWWHLYRVGLIC